MRTQNAVRAEFWRNLPPALANQARVINGTRRPRYAPQNMQPVDIRCAFVEFVDQAQRSGQISSALADVVTL